MGIWHLTWSTEGRHPLAPSEEVRRRVVRTLARITVQEAVLFCVVDDHVHLVILADEKTQGAIRRVVTMGLRTVASARVDRPFARPVRDRGHMEWLADQYILRQPWKHGLATHPALWSGSCFVDLVGARHLDGLKLRLSDALPRYTLRRAYRAVWLPEHPLAPLGDDSIRAAGAARIAVAASASLAADPRLEGNGAPEVLARRAVAALATRCGIGNAEVAYALRVDPDAAARLRRRPVPDPVLRAVRLHLALEEAVRAAPPPPSAPSMAGEPEPAPYLLATPASPPAATRGRRAR